MTNAPLQVEIAPRSTMREVLESYPGAQRALFRRYHIGGCSSCGFEPAETLAELCARNANLDVGEVIAHIRTSHEQDQKILLPPGELAEWLKNGFNGRLLDIRTREEFEAARIEGAVLFTQDLMNEMLGRWPREQTVVIYDHLGKKSMDAAAYFLGHGFQNIRALRGGIDAWSQEIDPKVRRYRLE
jgi:rhodanese-related sulfurtransferase